MLIALKPGSITESMQVIRALVYGITVQDNGKGISEANAQKLFTPFFTTKREQGGTRGHRGLVIVRSLLAACKADIAVVPSKGGACFEVRLPV